KRVVAESVGVPLGQNDDGLPGARGVFVRGSGIPAGVDKIVFGIRRALRRVRISLMRTIAFSAEPVSAEAALRSSAAARPRDSRNGAIQSNPHSSGRTTRFSSRGGGGVCSPLNTRRS